MIVPFDRPWNNAYFGISKVIEKLFISYKKLTKKDFLSDMKNGLFLVEGVGRSNIYLVQPGTFI